MPGWAPTVDVNRLPSVARMTISEVERVYRLYRDGTDGEEGPPADASADVFDRLDVIFAQEDDLKG